MSSWTQAYNNKTHTIINDFYDPHNTCCTLNGEHYILGISLHNDTDGFFLIASLVFGSRFSDAFLTTSECYYRTELE